MAHHGNTPPAVLNAPTRTLELVVGHEGATRHERRHGIPFGELKIEDFALYVSTRNVPHVATTGRRGRRVRRNRIGDDS